MGQPVQILFPPGRFVAGSMYEPNTKDMQGAPMVIKSGPDAGKPRQDWFFAVAIAKEPGHTHWAQTEWGKQIWAVGHAGFPQGQGNNPTFAWKVTDGDSTVIDAKGRKPCDKEGYKGHWVIRFGSGFAPKLYNRDGTQQLTQPNAINPGDYLQVLANVDGNGQMTKPGVYLNHALVALAGYGERIVTGPNAAAVGFGQSALPQGASAVPLAGMPVPAAPGGVAPTVVPPALPGAAPLNPALPPLPGSVSSGGAPIPPVMTQVPPNPAFLQAAAAPPMPPAAPGRRMLPPANGASYEQMLANGWTDALLLQHGMMAV